MESTKENLSILMLPWLGHGHISPYLKLAKKLTTKNFQIYLCSTPANLESIKKNSSFKYSNSIQLIELHLSCLPELPAHYHTTNGLPPHLMSTLKQAFDMSTPAFSKILQTLKPDLLIYDFFQSWAPIMANSYKIPAVQFIIFNASFISFFFHYCGEFPDSDRNYPFPEIHLSSFERIGFENMKRADNGIFHESTKRSNKIVLIKTFREIEGKYLDYIESSMGKRMIPTGVLVEDSYEEGFDKFKSWLDEKSLKSTVFVSFGSEYYNSKEELKEIALGLEQSEVNFIWVIRFPSGENIINIQQVLPDGFLERVSGRGFVVEGWAPQMRILQHHSIAGFVSHCGASSVMESLQIGIPVIAMPMQLDQPIIARLLKSLGLGMEVKRDEEGRYCREEIARVIKRVVVEDDGKDLQRCVEEMSRLMMEKGDEEIDEVAKEFIQLCNEANKI